MDDSRELIRKIEESIEQLPKGYISKKNLNGKIRYYRQWKEAGKVKSEYIREEDVADVTESIEKRKALQKKLRELQKKLPAPKGDKMKFKTNIKTGDELHHLVEDVTAYEKRDCYAKINRYLYGNDRTRVCAVFGLRRTGKTTMLFQAIADMSSEDFAKTAYVKLRTADVMNDIVHDLDKLNHSGFKYVFIDEVTLMNDFIDSAALFSDIYAMMGMKIVLSGTDSLGFWFARDNELYDRVRMVHTTFIPYREYSRLLGIDSIDEYIKYGGTLRMGETDFDNEDNYAEDASFRDDEATRRYIDTAISKNIQHSLACYEFGRNFGHLQDLYDANELTNAINRIIEDMNHSFVLSVLTREFKSHDLGLAARNLGNERNPQKRTDILNAIDTPSVTKKLMELLEIKNREDYTVDITSSHVARIKEYLKALDLIMPCPVRYAGAGLEPLEYTLFLQPGMRYCQAQALVYALTKDEAFMTADDATKNAVAERILEEVRGRMLEDIILLETQKALGKQYEVFKYRFASGEYDMVIYDKENNCCAAYEIKHSGECIRDQARHLLDEEKLSLTSPRFGRLAGRYVLYLGEDCNTEEGIAYRNAEQYLKALPNIDIESGMEETESEDEDQGFYPSM